MKAGAYFFAIIWSLLMVQLPFTDFNSKTDMAAYSDTKPVKSCCSKSKCSKPKPVEDKKDCEKNDCNPLMSCPAGNFFLNNNSVISITSLLIPKQKISLVNDNRISKQLTECWHPPEII